jgi:predicted DNA-binding protein|tara:strand:+ start:2911 stop:3162 length:252 start_codon:yes stop_codon:yes gene_type:complete
MDKLTTLKAAINARHEEIFDYQINIDNYLRALEKIRVEHADKPGMNEFAENLSKLHDSCKTEQLKAIIIRDVIADQIAELEAT